MFQCVYVCFITFHCNCFLCQYILEFPIVPCNSASYVLFLCMSICFFKSPFIYLYISIRFRICNYICPCFPFSYLYVPAFFVFHMYCKQSYMSCHLHMFPYISLYVRLFQYISLIFHYMFLVCSYMSLYCIIFIVLSIHVM